MTIIEWAIVFAVGFLIMIPIGPVSTICIRRSLLFGRWAGIVAGAGDVLAVAVYASIGVAGSTLLTHFFAPYSTVSHVIIAIVLFAVAFMIWRAKPKLPDVVAPTTTTLATGFLAALGLALANPADIVLFAALFAGLGIIVHSEVEHVLFFVTMFAGGCAYWIVVALFLDKWRSSLNAMSVLWLNRVCSVLMALAGCSSLVSLMQAAK